MNQQVALLRVEKKQLEDDRKDQVRQKAQLELNVNSLKENEQNVQQNRQNYQQKLDELLAAIEERKAELETINPDYLQRRNQETQIRNEYV